MSIGGPAGSGFIEFCCSNVDACEFCFTQRMREEVGEEPCFVRATTGEVQDVPLGRKLWIEKRESARLQERP